MMQVKVSGFDQDASYREIGELQFVNGKVVASPPNNVTLQGILEADLPWEVDRPGVHPLRWMRELWRYYNGPRLSCSKIQRA